MTVQPSALTPYEQLSQIYKPNKLSDENLNDF